MVHFSSPQERIRRIQLVADAAFDVSVNREAQSVFKAFIKHLKDANLTDAFFEEDKSEDTDLGITYFNTFPGRHGIGASALKNQHLLFCQAKHFTPVPRTQPLAVILAINEDIGQTTHGLYFGFNMSHTERKTLVMFYYLPHDYGEPEDRFPVEEFHETFFKPNKQMREMESTFIHEYRHFVDDVQARQKSESGNTSRTITPTSHYGAYINSVKEINARYAEWIAAIVKNFRTKSISHSGIAANFPTFKDFWASYWTVKGFAPADLKIHINAENKRRLARRLYKFWDWAKTQPDLTQVKAARFVQKQSQDDEVYTPREF